MGIDFRKLTIGSRLKIKGGKTCTVVNIYGAGSAEVFLDGGKDTVSIDSDMLRPITLTPEILVCFGFDIRYGGSWRYSLKHGGEYIIFITRTDLYIEMPWTVTVMDTLTEETVALGQVESLHELQSLVYNITDTVLEPIGILDTTIRLMDERRSLLEVFEDVMDTIDKHISKEDPWWQTFGQVIEFDNGDDFAQFCYDYRYDFIEHLDMFMINLGEGNDTFEEIWEYNEDYIIQEFYGGQMPDLEELYMQNVMQIVSYACCTEEAEPYQWIIKSLEE